MNHPDIRAVYSLHVGMSPSWRSLALRKQRMLPMCGNEPYRKSDRATHLAMRLGVTLCYFLYCFCIFERMTIMSDFFKNLWASVKAFFARLFGKEESEPVVEQKPAKSCADRGCACGKIKDKEQSQRKADVQSGSDKNATPSGASSSSDDDDVLDTMMRLSAAHYLLSSSTEDDESAYSDDSDDDSEDAVEGEGRESYEQAVFATEESSEVNLFEGGAGGSFDDESGDFEDGTSEDTDSFGEDSVGVGGSFDDANDNSFFDNDSSSESSSSAIDDFLSDSDSSSDNDSWSSSSSSDDSWSSSSSSDDSWSSSSSSDDSWSSSSSWDSGSSYDSGSSDSGSFGGE
jgi:hypothetical protein